MLEKHFPITRGIIFQKVVASVKAVDGVSFSVKQGETLGIVGESGCGKSTLARCIMRLLDPTGGRVVFDGRDITKLSRSDMRPIRRELMMIFQDPYASLNPRKRVGFIVARRCRCTARHRCRDQAPGTGAARGRRPQSRALQPVPARVLGRPAAAHRGRARTRSRAEADRVRRARLGARRVRAGADPEPAGRPAEGLRPDLHLHRARPERRPSHLRPGHGHVPRQGGRGRRPRRLYVDPKHPYTGALLSAVPIPNPRSGAHASRSCSRATCRARSIHRPPAISTHAARGSTRGTATSTSRRSTISGTSTSQPATIRSSAGRCRRTSSAAVASRSRRPRAARSLRPSPPRSVRL